MDHDDVWHELMDKRLDKHERLQPGFRALWDVLHRAVARNDELVVVPPEPLLLVKHLAAHGRHAHPLLTRHVEGVPNRCHSNTARLWLDGEVDTVATGFALNDGMWRPHSWGLDGTTVVETTVPREGYWGITLTIPGTLLFALLELGSDEMAERTGRADIGGTLDGLATHLPSMPPPQVTETGAGIWTNTTWVAHRRPRFPT